MKHTLYNLGDSAIGISFGTGMSDELSNMVIRVYTALKQKNIFLDVVPAYNSVVVYFDNLEHKHVEQIIENTIMVVGKTRLILTGAEHILPVTYDGMDIEEVAEAKQMTLKKLIILHTTCKYRVAMVGFRPNFPYLLGMDPRLEMPRRSDPRTNIPAGSVAIGGLQTGVYPCDGPGGWNIIGNTDIELLKTIKVGDSVRFIQV